METSPGIDKAISGAGVRVYGPAAAAMFDAYQRLWYFGVSRPIIDVCTSLGYLKG